MTTESSTERHRELFSRVTQVSKYTTFVEQGLFDHERRAIDSSFTRPSGRVLDLGCGAGRTTVELTERGFDVVGVDISGEMVAQTARTVPAARVLTATATDLPFPDGSFEYVLFSYNGLDYLAPETDRERALAEIGRVLTPDGTFVFSSHNTWGVLPSTWWNPLAYLRRAGFLCQQVRSGFRSPLYLTEVEDVGEFAIYCTDPVSQKHQLDARGLALVEVVGRYPSRPLALVDPWPYYVATKKG